MININLKNCNNIDKGSIIIKKNTLNIKYGINGTGKSTIAKSLNYFINDRDNGTNLLNKLKPFKFLRTNNFPEIDISDEINNVKIFDEKYVNEFVFQRDELLKGSFDIFIRNQTYEVGIENINFLIINIKNTFSSNEEINSLIEDFNKLSNYFGRPTKSGIHASSVLSKTFKNGNKVMNIPENLTEYSDYIKHENNYSWIKWQLEGQDYLNVTEKCPYCVSNIEGKKDKIEEISKVYDSKSVENLNNIIKIFDNLNEYFSNDTNLKINQFIKNIEGYTDEEVNYLKEIQSQIIRLNERFFKAKNISFSSLKDVEKLIVELSSYKIDLALYNHLESVKTQEKVNIINESIEDTLEKIGELQGEINKQKRLIENLVREHKIEINSFLKKAGYKYEVDLIDNGDGNYKLKLKYIGLTEEISEVEEHLSYGERNAFSLVLFMYDSIKRTPDLIILDDPISSFDKNKKYALVDMLFKREKCFKGKTVLLLTHDFEPIIDIKLTHKSIFGNANVSFLENIEGELNEKEINFNDILSFSEICEVNAKNKEVNIINRLVYLRRLFEIKNSKNSSYELISNLLHKRDTPIIKSDEVNIDMTQIEINEAIEEIKLFIEDFDYSKILVNLKDDSFMKKIYFETESNYEKLHIFRIIFDDKSEVIKDMPIKKFINESFHIENDYIYQLNPRHFQMIPKFVIDECDSAVNEL